MLFRLLCLIIKYALKLIYRAIRFPFRLISEDLKRTQGSGYAKKQRSETTKSADRTSRAASDYMDSDSSDNRAGGGRSGLFLDHAVADNSSAGHRHDNNTD